MPCTASPLLGGTSLKFAEVNKLHNLWSNYTYSMSNTVPFNTFLGREDMATSCWLLWSWKLCHLENLSVLRGVGVSPGKPSVLVCVDMSPVRSFRGWVVHWLRKKAILSICFRRGVPSSKEHGKGTDRGPEPDQSLFPNSYIHHPNQFHVLRCLKNQMVMTWKGRGWGDERR